MLYVVAVEIPEIEGGIAYLTESGELSRDVTLAKRFSMLRAIDEAQRMSVRHGTTAHARTVDDA